MKLFAENNCGLGLCSYRPETPLRKFNQFRDMRALNSSREWLVSAEPTMEPVVLLESSLWHNLGIKEQRNRPVRFTGLGN